MILIWTGGASPSKDLIALAEGKPWVSRNAQAFKKDQIEIAESVIVECGCVNYEGIIEMYPGSLIKPKVTKPKVTKPKKVKTNG